MIMNLERIQTADHQYFHELFNLYVDSFPREERRELNSLKAMLIEKSMYFSAVSGGNELVGLVVYWEFEDFLYLEHLAVKPDHRGKGIALAVLKKLQGKGNPILLEVEIPHDVVSAKRVDFYNRAGFKALAIPYLQPPYREGESLLPMMLFSDHPDWEKENLNRCIELFQVQVYYSWMKG